MKLIERLQRKEKSEFTSKDYTSARNQHLIIGEYTISIQCSSTHYCEPRKTLENLEDYTRMEMALWLTSGGGFLDPYNFEDFEAIEELKKSFDGGVYGCVSIDCLDKFIKYLEVKED